MPKKKTCPNCGSKMEGPKYECRKANGKEYWYANYTCVCKQPLTRRLKPYEVKRIKKRKLIEMDMEKSVPVPLSPELKKATIKDLEKSLGIEIPPEPFYHVEEPTTEDMMDGHTHRKDKDAGPLADDMPTELDALKKKMRDCSEVCCVEIKVPKHVAHLPMLRELHITPEDRGPYNEIEAILGSYPMEYEPISELNLRLVGEYQIVVIIGTPVHVTYA